MNTMKKNGGFTLVELIIVIAILAILSTGAIAGYSAYIQSANDASVNTILGDVYTSAVLANAQAGAIDEILVEENEGSWTITIKAARFAGENGADFAANFGASLKVTGAKFEDGNYVCTLKTAANWESSKTYAGKDAKWTAGEWKAVQ